MKNIYVLPTDKPSKLYYWEDKLVFGRLSTTPINRNIYITSDETAYPYALHLKNQEVLKIKAVGENSGELYHDKGFSYPEECKKIILTTDQDLIKDGVQAIDDEFLEWFVKNPSCEEVVFSTYHVKGDISGKLHYKIIIPKEEPKQETLGQIPEKQENCCTPIGHIRRYKDCIGCDRKPKQETLEEVSPMNDLLKDLKETKISVKESIDIIEDEFMRTQINIFVQKTLDSVIDRIENELLEMESKWQQKRRYSEEDMLEFSEWVSHNDWVYLPSKGCWVNEEVEESEEKFTTKELFEKFKNK